MSCPDSTRVAMLLDCPGTADDEQWLMAHLESCPTCPKELDSSLGEVCRPRLGLVEGALPEPLRQRLLAADPTGPPVAASEEPTGLCLGPPRTPGAIGSLGPYDLIEELGRGGFGVVYKARDPQLNKLFAIKVIRPELAENQTYLDLLLEEARKSNEVTSPYVVPVLRLGMPPEFQCPCLVMEYVEGEPLRTKIKKQTNAQRRTSYRETARIIQRVAEGLHALHEKGVVHRDVKPANILIDGGTGVPKLTDFGLAIAIAGEARQTSDDEAGTLPYMSPETLAGAERRPWSADRRSDVYSLGVVLYECLVGERPFRAISPAALRRQVLYDPPAPPRTRNEAIPRDLETIVLKCLAKDPDERYATAGELAADLGRFLADQPIRARPASRLRRVRLWCRRNPWAASLVALASLIVAALVIVPWIVVGREQRLRGQVERERDRARQSYQERVATLTFVAGRLGEALPLDDRTKDIRARLERDLLRHFRETVEADPEPDSLYYADACAVYAYFAASFGQREEARVYHEKAVALYDAQEDPSPALLEKHAKSQHNLAGLCHDLGRREEAFHHLERSLALWQALERQTPESGPRPEIGYLLNQRGHFHSGNGRLAEALADYEEAQRRLEAVLKARPKDIEIAGTLAGLKRNLGNVWHDMGLRGEPDKAKECFLKARDCYREAIAATRAVIANGGEGSEFLNDLAEHCGVLGVAEKSLGHTQEALAAYEESARIRRGLVEKHRGDTVCLEGLARTLHNLAILQSKVKDLDKARAGYEEAVRHREILVQLRPDNADYWSSLGNTHLKAAQVEFETGDARRAMESLDKSVRCARKAIELVPSRPLFLDRLVQALHERGQVVVCSRTPEAAIEPYREAIVQQLRLLELTHGAPADQSDLAALHFDLAAALVQLNQPGEAIVEYETAGGVWKGLGGVEGNLHAAHAYSRCASLVSGGASSARSQFVSEAVSAVRRAIEAGFKDVESLRQDRDFQAIRDTEEFRKLTGPPPGKPAPH